MVQKKLLTEEELLELLNSKEVLEEPILEESDNPVAAFLAFYGISEGEYEISSKDLYSIYTYKYGKDLSRAIFAKELSKFIPKRHNHKFLINKDLSRLFSNKTKRITFTDSNRIELIIKFYEHFEIQKGSEIVISGDKLVELIKQWWATEKKKKYRLSFKTLSKFIDKFFTKKDTKKGIYYSMKSDKLQRFMDEIGKKEQTKKQKK